MRTEGKQLQQGQSYLQVYEAQLKSTSFSFKNLGKSALSGLKALGAGAINALGGMAIGAGASLLLNLGSKFVDKLITTKKEVEEAKQKIKELGEEAQSSIDSITSSLEENTKTINDVKQKYAELAQGINNLGKVSQNQGTLSNDEYSEFLDISNQLAELFPQLTVGYDDNGNAILNLSGNVGTITGQLNDLIEAEKELAAQKIRNDIGATWDAFGENIEESENKISSLEETIKTYNNALSEFQKISSGGQVYMNSSSIDQYAEAFKAVGIIKSDANFFDKKDNKYLLEARNSDGLMGIDFSKLSKTQKDKIEGYLKQTVQSYNTQLEAAQNELVNRNKEFSTNVIASVMDSDAYQNTDNKSIIDTILTNYDYTQLYKDFDGNWENAYNYLYNQIIGAFDGQNGKEIQNIWNNLLSIDTDAALAENIPKIEAYIKQLAELLNIDPKILGISLGYDTEEYKNKINQIKDNAGYSYKSGYALSDEESNKNQKINDFVSKLSEEDANTIIELGLEIPDSVLDYNEEQIKNWIAEQNKNAVIETKIRTSTDAVDSLEDTKKALSSLDDLYSQTVLKNASGDGIANGFASPDTINAVESAFGGIAEEDAKVASALEEFEETLVKFPNDSEKAQDAINNLVTAYIDQTDILQDLTEENKEWAKVQLKAMGITNAEEVVESRLNQKIKKNIEAFGKYKESVADYSKKLSTLDNTDEGYSDALEGMRAGFEELFNSMNQFKDENGEVITVPISTEFAQNNLEDLMAAANGSTEALDRLQAAATADYMVQCGINVPSEAKDGLRTRMNSLISQIQSEVKDVKVGAYLNNSQAISALVQLAKQAGLSSKEVNNALSSIGVEPQVTYTNMEVPDLEENLTKNNAGTSSFAGYRVKEYKKVKLPIVKYVKKSGGTGTGAIYGGGSGGSSSGGSGGGGGGGSSSTKDPETFDWIETAITRAEESISRLDKVINNTYQNWSDRNIAVGNKIKEVSNEIDLQKKAYQGYIDKANSIGLSDAYKKKVQNGTIQIEDIKDEKLSEKIKAYEQWYNKAIACKDAVKDLNTTLSDLAKMKFDNVVKQFEEIEQVFTDANDLIQKRLDYAEERGMIASKAYYQAMMANSTKNRQHLAKQLTRMQQELNKGVSSGSIKKGSEEWYSMTQEIEKTKQSIVETDTEIRKFANDIRQINWDTFDLGQEMISNVIDETDFLVSLIEKRDNLTDGTKSRGLTNDGIAMLGAHSSNYNMYIAKSQEYAKKIKEINNQLAKDPTNQDLLNQKNEYLKSQRESILAAEDEKQAMIDLARQGYDAVLENMQELIDKRKEYLNQEKSIYEYQKNITEQTKNIASLRKQLAVYENDNSEEARKKVQQLKVSIQEAEQNLKDTEYDKYISDQEEMLDKIYQDYSDTIDDKFENIDSLFKELISIVNKFDGNIQSTLYRTAQDAGYNLSEEIKGIWSGDAKFTVSTFSKNFSTYATNVQKVLSSIWNKIDYMTYVSWVDYNKQSGGTTNNQVTKQHASGLKKSTSDYLAWTQENGAEIVRTKDGALLYPVTSGTTIFTSDMTDNLWNFAKNPFEFISGIPSTISYSNHINNENNISLTIGDIRLDGVQNPEQFASQFISVMQNNSKVRKALQSGTIDLLAGKNSKRINNF